MNLLADIVYLEGKDPRVEERKRKQKQCEREMKRKARKRKAQERILQQTRDDLQHQRYVLLELADMGRICGVIGLIITLFVFILFEAMFYEESSNYDKFGEYLSDDPGKVYQKADTPSSDMFAQYGYWEIDGDNDSANWIEWAQDSLMRMSNSFKEKSGLYPFVVVAEEGTANSTAEAMDLAKEWYHDRLDSESGFLLVVCPTASADGYYLGYSTGKTADEIFDEQSYKALAMIFEETFGKVKADRGSSSHDPSGTDGIMLKTAENTLSDWGYVLYDERPESAPEMSPVPGVMFLICAIVLAISVPAPPIIRAYYRRRFNKLEEAQEQEREREPYKEIIEKLGGIDGMFEDTDTGKMMSLEDLIMEYELFCDD